MSDEEWPDYEAIRNFIDWHIAAFEDSVNKAQERLRELMIECANSKTLSHDDQLKHVLSKLAEHLYGQQYPKIYKGKKITWSVDLTINSITPHEEDV